MSPVFLVYLEIEYVPGISLMTDFEKVFSERFYKKSNYVFFKFPGCNVYSMLY